MKKTLIIATAAGLAMSSGVEETQDNELFMNAIKNGYYTVSNAILSRPAMIAGGMQMIQNGMARPTFLNHFDEAADDEFMAKGHGQGQEGKQKGKKGKDGKKNKDGKKPRPEPVQEAQPIDQVQDNNLALEDDEFGALNVGVNGGNNGFGANAGYQGNIGRNGNWNVGGQIQTQPGGRPNWGVNAGVTFKFDEQEDEFYAEDQDDEFFAEDQDDEFYAEDQDDEFFAEDQDDELFMQSLKNGYYTVSNAILSRPAMIAGGMQMIQNGMARPTFLNHFDETADDEFMAKGHGQGQGQGHEGKQKGKKGKDGKKNKDGKKPRPEPVQEAQPVDQVQDNNLALEDDEFYAEDQDDEFFAEDQDDELFMQSIKNGYYTVSNAILSRPAMIAGGMQMIQNGMARPTFLNHFDETADDEFAAAAEKTEKPKRKRQPLERPEGMIKKNTKLRVPKEVAADNTLFDLAELLEDN